MRRTILLTFLMVSALGAGGGYVLYSQQQAIERLERRLEAGPAPAAASDMESLMRIVGELEDDVRALEDQVQGRRFGAVPRVPNVEGLEDRVARLERCVQDERLIC